MPRPATRQGSGLETSLESSSTGAPISIQPGQVIFSYRGKPIEEYTHKELIQIMGDMVGEMERMRVQHVHEINVIAGLP